LLQGQPQVLFIIFAGVYVTGAMCWLGVDVTKRLTNPE
jgi:hypothetical protein